MQNDALIYAISALAIALLALQRLHVRMRVIEAKMNKLLALHGIDGNALQEPSVEVLELALAGKKISAIKAYRRQTGAELKEAKEVIAKHSTPSPSAPNA